VATANLVLPDQLESTLALAVEPELVRACLLEPVGREQRLVAWINVERDPHAALSGQIAAICQRLSQRIGREIWNDIAYRPFRRSANPVLSPSLGHVVASINPRPRLRVWLTGLSTHGSLSAAELAISATPSKVVGSTLLKTTSDGHQLAMDLTYALPDVLVIAGGYDSQEPAACNTVLALCDLVGDALSRLRSEMHPLIIYAGNRWAADEARQLLHHTVDNLRVSAVNNVQPGPETVYLTELVRAMRNEHWRLSRQTLGIATIEQWITEPAQLASLDSGFAQLLRVWMEYQGLPELHGAYVAPNWHLHVWAKQSHEVVRMHYLESSQTIAGPSGWPRLQLLSGPQPNGNMSLPALRWWDRSGMAPMVSALGQISPTAMLQVMQRDLFRT